MACTITLSAKTLEPLAEAMERLKLRMPDGARRRMDQTTEDVPRGDERLIAEAAFVTDTWNGV